MSISRAIKNNPIVSLLRTPFFVAGEYLHRRPASNYRPGFVEGGAKAKAQDLAKRMHRDGIVIVDEYFPAALTQKLKQAFDETVRGRESKSEDGRVLNPDAFHHPDIMRADPIFEKVVLDDFILEVIGNYFQRPFGVAIAAATRLLPTPPVRLGSFRWHHDARGRQVNLMVLLTDVTAKGQRMSYLRGTHNRYYSHFRGRVNPCFDEDLDSATLDGNVVEVVGKGGTIALFDSNGLHSGNRNGVEGRDTLGINYVSEHHFKRISFPRDHLDKLPSAKKEVITRNNLLQLFN